MGVKDDNTRSLKTTRGKGATKSKRTNRKDRKSSDQRPSGMVWARKGQAQSADGQTPGQDGKDNKSNPRVQRSSQKKGPSKTKGGKRNPGQQVVAALAQSVQAQAGQIDALKDIIADSIDVTAPAVSTTTSTSVGATITIGGASPLAVTTTVSTPASIPPAPAVLTPKDSYKSWQETPPSNPKYGDAYDDLVGDINTNGWEFSFMEQEEQDNRLYLTYIFLSYAYLLWGLSSVAYNSLPTFALWLVLKAVVALASWYASNWFKMRYAGPVGLLLTLTLNTFFGYLIKVTGAGVLALPFSFTVCYWVFAALLHWLGLNSYPFPTYKTKFTYSLVRGTLDPTVHHDMRSGPMSLGPVEHLRPLNCLLRVQRSGLVFFQKEGDAYVFLGEPKPQILNVSAELFCQITNPRVLQHGSSPEENSRHLNRQASATHSVNISKYDHLRNNDHYGDTILAAYGYIQFVKQRREDCPFWRAPLTK